jgi:hypothetical protein
MFGSKAHTAQMTPLIDSSDAVQGCRTCSSRWEVVQVWSYNVCGNYSKGESYAMQQFTKRGSARADHLSLRDFIANNFGGGGKASFI